MFDGLLDHHPFIEVVLFSDDTSDNSFNFPNVAQLFFYIRSLTIPYSEKVLQTVLQRALLERHGAFLDMLIQLCYEMTLWHPELLRRCQLELHYSLDKLFSIARVNSSTHILRILHQIAFHSVEMEKDVVVVSEHQHQFALTAVKLAHSMLHSLHETVSILKMPTPIVEICSGILKDFLSPAICREISVDFVSVVDLVQEIALSDLHASSRVCALECLTGLLRRVGFSADLYARLQHCLVDPDERVRISALTMMGEFLCQNSRRESTDGNGVSGKDLQEAAFLSICQLVTDMSPLVRIRAFEVISTLPLQDEHSLLHTLTKDPAGISNKQDSRRGNARDRDGDIAFLHTDSAINGAFIFGLEDEEGDVRVAAVRSLFVLTQKFSAQFRSFTETATDLLVDMISDESDRVREAVLCALSSLDSAVALTDTQVVSPRRGGEGVAGIKTYYC